MHIMNIECPHCGGVYMTVAKTHTDPCPICGKPVVVVLTSAKIDVLKGE